MKLRSLSRSSFVGLGVLLAILGGDQSALAQGDYELRGLYRDVRSKAMGGVGVALELDDRDAVQGIFGNPAQMAGNRTITLHYLGLDLGASWDTYSAVTETASAFSNFTPNSLNVLMGKNVFGYSQIVSAITLPNFGIAAIMDGQFAFYAQNQAYPEFTVAYMTTTGIQASWGTVVDLSRVAGRRRPRKQNSDRDEASGGSELRLGLGGKMLWRRGGYKEIPLTTLLSASTDSLKALMGSFETGYGVDAGMQYVHKDGSNLSWSLGASIQNIGDVHFSKGVADPVPNNLTAGAAVKYSLGGITSATLSYDQAYLLTTTDWRKRNHLGVEWELPGLSVFGGIYQTYLTYGASFDAWILRVTAASYAEELGGMAYQNGNRRYLVRLAMRLAL